MNIQNRVGLLGGHIVKFAGQKLSLIVKVINTYRIVRLITMTILLSSGCQPATYHHQKPRGKCNGCEDMVYPTGYYVKCEFTDHLGENRLIPILVKMGDNEPQNTIYHVIGRPPDGTTIHYYCLDKPFKKDGMLCITNPSGSDHYVDFTSFDIEYIHLKHLPLSDEDLEKKNYIYHYKQMHKECPLHEYY